MKKTQMNLKQFAYETIKEKILRCEYKPNDILSETIIMETVDASRTPIREALNMLAQEGLVQIIPKKGIMILPITIKEIAMTFEARCLLEPYVVEKYGNYIDKDRLKAIRLVSEKIVKNGVGSQETAGLFARSDDDLHETIAGACKNKYLLQNLQQVFNQNMRIRILSEESLWERHQIAAKEHTEIIDCILAGNMKEAALSMRSHLMYSKDAAFSAILEMI